MANGYGTGGSGTTRSGMRGGNQQTTSGNNPIVETFYATQHPKYYFAIGQPVALGTPLHRHADGTVMTQHTMGTNDNSVVVATLDMVGRVRSNPNIISRSNRGRTQTPATRKQRRINNRRSATRRPLGTKPRLAKYTFKDGTPYFGKVFETNGVFYSTTSGLREGNSQELVRIVSSPSTLRQESSRITRTRRQTQTRQQTQTMGGEAEPTQTRQRTQTRRTMGRGGTRGGY